MVAGCSYTLYLTHLPVLICLRACWTYERPWPSDLAHWGMVALVCLGCVVYAFMISLVTEANTDRVRRWLVGRLGNGARSPLQRIPSLMRTLVSSAYGTGAVAPAQNDGVSMVECGGRAAFFSRLWF